MSVAFVGGAEQQSIVEVILCIMLDGLERIVLIATANYKWKELLSGLCKHACICQHWQDASCDETIQGAQPQSQSCTHVQGVLLDALL